MLELTLPTMTCGHCVKTVTETVQRIDPAARLLIDLPTQRVSIESSASPDLIVSALSGEGYAPAPPPRD
jgi:copper chaperone